MTVIVDSPVPHTSIPVRGRLSRTLVGVDVQSVTEMASSMAHFGDRYVTKIYDPRETSHVRAHRASAARYLAGRFAAREAVLKLLEVTDVVASWSDIELRGDRDDAPIVELRGRALVVAQSRGITEILLSISAGRDTAIAVAVADVISREPLSQ